MLYAFLLAVLSLGFASAQQTTDAAWRTLFDGKTLQGWRETPFTGRGDVRIQDGVLRLERGKPMTGITWNAAGPPVPGSQYEVQLEAMRVDGTDFFASMTFPVGDSHCTWVTGGWGGDIVGLSSLDGWDASDNETRTYFTFETGRWYALKLQVTDTRIAAWIDGQRVINVSIAGREVGLRPGETKLMVPFGFASYGTTGALRNIQWRPLPRGAVSR